MSFQLFNVEIQQEKSKDNNSRKWSFKSYQFLIQISILQSKFQDDHYIQGFLELLDKQQKIEGDKVLKIVVDLLMNSNNSHLISNVLPNLLDKLKIYELNWNILCKDYYQKGNYIKLEEIINNIQSVLNNIFVQQYEQYIKSLYRQLLKFNLDLLETYISGIINITIGQQKDNMNKVERNLQKLSIISQMLYHLKLNRLLFMHLLLVFLKTLKMNLFNDLKSKVYDQDPNVKIFQDLRLSYEQLNVYSNIINLEYFQKDIFLILLKPYLQQIIVECKILNVIQQLNQIIYLNNYLSKFLFYKNIYKD